MTVSSEEMKALQEKWEAIEKQISPSWHFVSEIEVPENKVTQQDACESCPNNPKNNPFASGFCLCTLGTPTIY